MHDAAGAAPALAGAVSQGSGARARARGSGARGHVQPQPGALHQPGPRRRHLRHNQHLGKRLPCLTVK